MNSPNENERDLRGLLTTLAEVELIHLQINDSSLIQ